MQSISPGSVYLQNLPWHTVTEDQHPLIARSSVPAKEQSVILGTGVQPLARHHSLLPVPPRARRSTSQRRPMAAAKPACSAPANSADAAKPAAAPEPEQQRLEVEAEEVSGMEAEEVECPANSQEA